MASNSQSRLENSVFRKRHLATCKVHNHPGKRLSLRRSDLLPRRLDRVASYRIPFLSAMAMMGAKDGERDSYPEMVDVLSAHGAQAKADARALYRRVVFNVLISNVDDHLQNHGFLWQGKAGWMLAPAYDLNPVPMDLKARCSRPTSIWMKAPVPLICWKRLRSILASTWPMPGALSEMWP